MEHRATKQQGSKVQIDITLTPEEWEAERRRVEELLAKDFTAEGFRQGKAPVELMRAHVGEQAVLTETARRAVERAYLAVVREEGLEVVGEPELQVKKMAPGNPFEFSLTVPTLPALELPDYKEVAARVQAQEVAVQDKEVEGALEWLKKSKAGQGKEPPELTDAFARSLGSFQNAQEVRDSVREGLLQEKQLRERQRRRSEILDKIAELTGGEIPEVLVRRELEGMLENLKRGVREQLGMEFEPYLEKVRKSREELEKEFAEQARKRVKNSLVLRAIAKAEGVRVEEQELQEGMQQVLLQHRNPQEAKKEIDPGQLEEYTRGVLENEKTMQLLENQGQREQP